MELHLISFDAGSASLGRWGTVKLVGHEEAVIKTSMCEDIGLHGEIVRELLNERTVLSGAGRLLVLPSAGDLVACFDLMVGTLAYPVIDLARCVEDWGMRYGWMQIQPGWGVLHLTESSFCRFDEELNLVWHLPVDLWDWHPSGCWWDFKEIKGSTVVLKPLDGTKASRVYSLADGELVTNG